MNGLTLDERKALAQLMRKANRDDLNEVVRLFKAQQSRLTTMATAKWAVGDEVEFDSKYGSKVRGTIIKVNSKTIKMKSTDGVTWVVSPSLLHESVTA